MLLTINVWFFGVLLTSVTGSVAYGLWKLLERLFKRRRQYNWLMISSKLTVLFWIVPVVFLRQKNRHAHADISVSCYWYVHWSFFFK